MPCNDNEWQVPGGWGCTIVSAFQFQVMDSAIAGSARTEVGWVVAVVVRGLQGLTHYSTLIWSKLAHPTMVVSSSSRLPD